MGDDVNLQALENLFSEQKVSKFESMKSSGRKLAYYTNADTALKIITGKSIWMRNASLMNDFEEIEYGRNALSLYWDRNDIDIRALLDAVHPDLYDKIISRWEEVDSSISKNTFLLSLSEYEDDDRGRLSMWRGYGGGQAGVAFVFNPEQLGSISKNELFPVKYGAPEFEASADAIIASIPSLSRFVNKLDIDVIVDSIVKAVQDLVLTTKHPGFREEAEWRVIVSSDLTDFNAANLKVESIRGVPERIFKIGATSDSALLLQNDDFNKLIYKIVVGPCRHPASLEEALKVSLQKDDSTSNLSNCVVASDIPLRQRD
jgi:hypothetical protein